ncbi:MAG: carbamate kinase [Bacteroidales bacterium]|nr:carbamate kinase [Bacteroidales bacterium]
MTKTAVVALGGNAILRSGQKGSYQEQIANIKETCEALLPLVKRDCNLIITYGNGPQVGNVMLQHEITSRVTDVLAMPLDFCVSETQGSIGYLIEQGLRNVLHQHHIQRNVVSLITQVLVDKNDKMFQQPTKPIGPYYKFKHMKSFLADNPGTPFKEDPKGNGWRRVVASPQPLKILNIDVINTLAKAGHIVVSIGGGGIPIVETDNGLFAGVEAVIDKDLSSSLTAVSVHADEFYILTDVPKIYINFRKENEQALEQITLAQAQQYLEDGQFTEGSMAPKVRAAINFVQNTGNTCIITSANQLNNPTCGTKIIKQ